MGYGKDEPWEKRSNTKQDAFNKEANARAEVFLAEQFCPTIKAELSQELSCEANIRNYTESMFFGLTMRQFVFSLLAVGVAVGLYFLLRPYVGTETVSWMCVLGAAPFAALGFVSYHGMTAEQFLWAWFRSEMLEPREIRFEPVNYYYEALRGTMEAHEKEVSKSHD